MKARKKKQFYSVRNFRLSDEVFENLKRIKKGTWNYTFNNLIENYAKK